MLKKYMLISFVTALVLFAAACGNKEHEPQGNSETNNSEKANVEKNGSEDKEPIEEAVTVDQIIEAFKENGLEAENPTDLPNKEFGNIRKEGKRILVPSLGEDAGGRLFEFNNEDDLETAKSYYVELGNSGPLFYSHTYSKGNFLLQMNGDMEDGQFEKYKNVLDNLIK